MHKPIQTSCPNKNKRGHSQVIPIKMIWFPRVLLQTENVEMLTIQYAIIRGNIGLVKTRSCTILAKIGPYTSWEANLRPISSAFHVGLPSQSSTGKVHTALFITANGTWRHRLPCTTRYLQKPINLCPAMLDLSVGEIGFDCGTA